MNSYKKKFLIKNAIIITLILLVAVLATHHIYYKFKNSRDVDYSSESLEITFHDEDKINITKATQVTESVGLTAKSYTISIKNNLTEPVNYKISLLDNEEQVILDECEEIQIPKELLTVAIKEGNSKPEIYTLEELEDNILANKTIAALADVNITIRIWVANSDDTIVPANSHYHGMIKIEEDKLEE